MTVTLRTDAAEGTGCTSAPSPALLLTIGCPCCAGPLVLENHAMRRNVDGVGTEGIAVLACSPCRRRWDLFLHLSQSETKSPPLSGAQQRARARLRHLNTQ